MMKVAFTVTGDSPITPLLALSGVPRTGDIVIFGMEKNPKEYVVENVRWRILDEGEPIIYVRLRDIQPAAFRATQVREEIEAAPKHRSKRLALKLSPRA